MTDEQLQQLRDQVKRLIKEIEPTDIPDAQGACLSLSRVLDILSRAWMQNHRE